MPSINFTDVAIRNLKPGKKQLRLFEKLGRGCSLCLSVSPGGSKSWSVLLYDDNGKGKLYGLKNDAGKQARYPAVSLSEARRKALNGHHQPETVIPPPPPLPRDTFHAVAERYFHDLDRKGVRTVAHMRGQMERYAYPLWRDVEVAEIRRSVIMKLRDQIAAGEMDQPVKGWKKVVKLKGGTRTADQLVSTLHAIFGHHALRNDDFVNPVIRGMTINPGGQRRSRMLTDAEIKRLWEVTDIVSSDRMSPLDPVYCAIVRFLLLTAVREAKAVSMKWSDIDLATGLWTLPTAAREKPNVGKIILPAMALDVLAQMRLRSATLTDSLVFSADGKPFNKFARCKLQIDRLLKFESGWVLHDLRRTCRSIMSKVGISTEIAELSIGHTRGGVIDIYDQHDFLDEKSAALKAVSDHIAKVVGANVVQLAAAR